jgi:archaemetzincin
MHKILVVQLNKQDKILIEYVKEHLEQYGFNVDIVLDVIHIPLSYFDWYRMQYVADEVLKFLENIFKELLEYYDSIIGIADVDAYSNSLNFVFGIAIRKFGVVFTSRLKEEFYGKKGNLSLFLERVIKEVTHEIGHTLGLDHCKDRKCVMSFSNSIVEVDNKSPYFCDNCRRELQISTTKVRM